MRATGNIPVDILLEASASQPDFDDPELGRVLEPEAGGDGDLWDLYCTRNVRKARIKNGIEMPKRNGTNGPGDLCSGAQSRHSDPARTAGRQLAGVPAEPRA